MWVTRTVLIRLWSDHISLSDSCIWLLHVTNSCRRIVWVCTLQFSDYRLCNCGPLTEATNKPTARLCLVVLMCVSVHVKCSASAQPQPHIHINADTQAWLRAGRVCASLKLHLTFAAPTCTNRQTHTHTYLAVFLFQNWSFPIIFAIFICRSAASLSSAIRD